MIAKRPSDEPRPRSIAEILDRSVSRVVRDFGSLFGIGIVFIAIPTFVNGLAIERLPASEHVLLVTIACGMFCVMTIGYAASIVILDSTNRNFGQTLLSVLRSGVRLIILSVYTYAALLFAFVVLLVPALLSVAAARPDPHSRLP